MLASLALCSLLQVTAVGADGLSLANPRFTFGPLGPTRTESPVQPGDSLHLSFDIQGIGTDASGKASYSTSVEVVDANGRSVFRQAPVKYQEFLALGGNTLPAFAEINLGLDSPAGKYSMNVTVTDTTTMKSTSLKQPFSVEARKFDFIRLSISGDDHGNVPVGAFVVGQPCWVHAGIVGFVRAKTGTMQPNVEVNLSVLGPDGNAVAQPFIGQINAEIPANATTLPIRFYLPLNRAGNYTVQLTAKDSLGKGNAKLTFPLTVVAPK